MRLRTTCEGGHVSGFSHDHEHDAAMAHALVMAIGELQTMSEMLVTSRLRKRADEIMLGWGFGED